MAYTPPVKSDIRAGVSRDLRDPDNKTFTTQEVDDLVNQAIVEVGRVYPKQDVVEMAVTDDGQRQFTTDVTSLFRVELVKDGVVFYGVPRVSNMLTAAEDGWDLHGGILWMPEFAAQRLVVADSPTVRIWGYWRRDTFATADPDTTVFDGDAEAEFAVRTYALLLGYQRLQNDRILFQQWLTNTGNTDVSPNQLGGTADMYMSQWRELRNRLRGLQRV